MSRQKDNLKILEKLNTYFMENPDIRFWQGLWNLEIIEGFMDDSCDIVFEDKHHEEPDVTLEYVSINVEKQKPQLLTPNT